MERKKKQFDLNAWLYDAHKKLIAMQAGVRDNANDQFFTPQQRLARVSEPLYVSPYT